METDCAKWCKRHYLRILISSVAWGILFAFKQRIGGWDTCEINSWYKKSLEGRREWGREWWCLFGCCILGVWSEKDCESVYGIELRAFGEDNWV
jgi:hypothetical protein